MRDIRGATSGYAFIVRRRAARASKCRFYACALAKSNVPRARRIKLHPVFIPPCAQRCARIHIS
eukprot:6718419-Lingulodinium_polyedra.AAC.1